MSSHTAHVLSSSTVVGDKVKNAAGENLGKVEDLMLDTDNGRIRYAVVSFGGFLGMGGKYFAVPWSSLQVDAEDKCLRLDVPKEKLENAPGFDKDNWPNLADPSLGQTVYQHYGQPIYW